MRGTGAANLDRTVTAPRPSLRVVLAFGVMAIASACDRGTLDPAGGAGACGPVCDIYCAYGNVLDQNGCPTCACQPRCPDLKCATPLSCPKDATLPPGACPSCGCPPCPAGTSELCDMSSPPQCECVTPATCDGVAPEQCTDSIPPHCTCDSGLACAKIECGGPPPPLDLAPCPNGAIPPLDCVRNDDRQTCTWRARTCLPTHLPIP